MMRLRLFHRDDLSNQIDSRTLDEGEIVIGRDAKADWTVEDLERAMSRRHLVVAMRGGMVTVKDTSANGVFLGNPRQRIERDRQVPLARGEAVQFGPYLLLLEEDAGVASPPSRRDIAPPFEADDSLEQRAAPSRRSQPFGAALKADPLADRTPVSSEDAWDRRHDPVAGSWDDTGRKRPEHNTLIGSDRHWAQPPEVQRESGLGFDAPFTRPILEKAPVEAGAAMIPSDWMAPVTPAADAAEPGGVVASDPILPAEVIPDSKPVTLPDPIVAPAPAVRSQASPPGETTGQGESDDSFFLHFCSGAGLRPEAFAGENRAEVMERAGAVYRQAVLGIADLMQERTALRNEYRMVHTTVRPEGNNPFKWVPPQRIAVELLRAEGGGYTTGDRALNEALHDLKAHLLCMLAGMRAALTATFDALAPSATEARVPDRNYLIKAQRDAALWAEYVMLAERLRVEAEDSSEGVINRAFREAYEMQANQLNGSGRRR